ncbi:MAG: C40 family peptidase [Anaerovoracaceae bacterium]|jgi:cell wall-associated NlpC family hydrolase
MGVYKIKRGNIREKVRRSKKILLAPVLALAVSCVCLAVPADASSSASGSGAEFFAGGTGIDAVQNFTAPYEMISDGKVIAVVEDAEAAKAVLTGVKFGYSESISEEQASDITSKITVKRVEPGSTAVSDVQTVDEAVEAILEQNDAGEQPVLTVKRESVDAGVQTIAPATKVIKTSSLYEGETKVKEQGESGRAKVTKTETVVNGETVESEVISTDVLKEAETRVVYQGTKEEKTGESVIEYAKKFLGNPYVWGGESLTDGCDCSGFTMKIFEHFGVSLPHSSYAQENYGEEVSSLSEAKAGDLICYGSHVAIYIGNGQIIHAANPDAGICIGQADYREIKTIRRLV